MVDDKNYFIEFSRAGRELAKLHLDYENLDPYPEIVISGDIGDYTVKKLCFRSKDDKSTIIYNNIITISNIPEKAYQYTVNGKSAIEWIIDRYQIKTDNKSGIVNDPNNWAIENNKPRYILDLILSIINLSVKSVDIIDNLPKLEF